MNVFFPDLNYPFPSLIHIRAADIADSTRHWVQYYNLFDPKQIKRKKRPLSKRTARLYPQGIFERITLVDKLHTLLLLIEESLQQTPDHIRLMYDGMGNPDPIAMYEYYRENYRSVGQEVIAVLKRKNIPMPEEGLIPALHNVWEQMCQLSDRAWQQRFLKATNSWLMGLSMKRDTLTPPPAFGDLHEIMPNLSPVRLLTLLNEFATDSFLPEDLVKDKDHQAITLHAQKAFCMTDDLFRLYNSTDRNDRYNIAMVVAKAYHVSLPDAVDKVVELHDFHLQQFIDQQSAFSENEQWYHARSRDAIALTHIMKGNVDWWMRDVIRDHLGFGPSD